MVILHWWNPIFAPTWPPCSNSQPNKGSNRFSFSFYILQALLTYIDGAAKQGSSLQSLANDSGQVTRWLLEIIHFCYTSCEVLKALRGAAPRQSLVRAVQPVYRQRCRLGGDPETLVVSKRTRGGGRWELKEMQKNSQRARKVSEVGSPPFWKHYFPPLGLTWHRPFPEEHSRTLGTLQNAQIPALHLWLAVCHQSPHPPIHQTARSEEQKQQNGHQNFNESTHLLAKSSHLSVKSMFGLTLSTAHCHIF